MGGVSDNNKGHVQQGECCSWPSPHCCWLHLRLSCLMIVHIGVSITNNSCLMTVYDRLLCHRMGSLICFVAQFFASSVPALGLFQTVGDAEDARAAHCATRRLWAATAVQFCCDAFQSCDFNPLLFLLQLVIIEIISWNHFHKYRKNMCSRIFTDAMQIFVFL